MGRMETSSFLTSLQMEKWKIILLRAAGLGAGLGFTVAVIILSVGWWVNRPVKPKPWDKTAITANLRNAHNEDGKISLTYELENHTDKDLRMVDSSGLHITLRMSDAIVAQNVDNYVTIATPIFIPARQTALVILRTTFPVSDDTAKKLTQEEDVNKQTDILLTPIAQEWANLNGVVIFVESDRYEIECGGIDKAIKEASAAPKK
jgi:hypothetical protein